MKISHLGLSALVFILPACGGTQSQQPQQLPSNAAAAPPAPPTVAEPKEAQTAPAATSMFDLQMRSLREYVRAYNKHDAKAIAALYAEEAVFVERGEFVSAGGGSIESNFKSHFDAFPDTTTSITRSWHSGDAVLFEWAEGGTHTGPQRAHKPTGKKYGYVGASLLRFKADGLVKQDTTYADELTKEVQLAWAPAQLAKLEVRPVVAVPAATEAWDAHQVKEADAAQAKLAAARKSLYTNFSVRSEKDFLASLSDDVVLYPFDDPKDAKGKREAALLLKDWMKMFSDGVVDATEGWSVDGHVVLLGTFTGKHVGAWGPLKATNKTFKSHFLDIARVNKDDKIERLWSYANNYELLSHLGYQKDEVTETVGRDPMSPK